MNLSVMNGTGYTVDAFDYKIQAFNAYGEKVSSSLLDDFTCTNMQLKAGSVKEATTAIPLVNSATSFKVAITRYHIVDTDETVKIPTKNLDWHDASK